MATELTNAKDKSTYIVTASFKDEAGDAVVPNSITWTLTDINGNVINSREDVTVTTPAASVDIVLSDNDLDVTSYASSTAVLLIEAVVNLLAGNDKAVKDEVRFLIEDLVAV